MSASTNNDVTEKKKNRTGSIHRFLHFYRSVLMKIIISILAVVYILFILGSSIERTLIEMEADLSNSNVAYFNSMQLAGMNKQIFVDCINDINEVEASSAVRILNDKEITVSELDILADNEKDGISFYYIDSDGTIISDSLAPKLNINEGELDELYNNGFYIKWNDRQEVDASYAVKKCNNGKIIVKNNSFQSDSSLYKVHSYNDIKQYYYYADSYDASDNVTLISDNNMTEKKKETMVSSEISSGVKFVQVFYLSDENKSAIPAIYIGLVECNKDIDDQFYICSYVSFNSIISDVFGSIEVLTILVIFLFYFSLRASYYFRKDWKNSKKHGKDISIGKHFRIDVLMLFRILFVQISMGVLTLLVGVFLQFIYDFAGISLSDNSNIDLIENALVDNAEDKENLYGLFESWEITNASTIADYIGYMDENDIDEYLNEMLAITGAEEISVYDEKGVIVNSTSEYKGYRLSNNSNDQENELWNLIDGEKKEMIIPLNNQSGKYYCGIRRRDCIGLIKVTYNNDKIIAASTSFENMEAALKSGYESTYIITIDRECDSIMNVIDNSDTSVQQLNNVIPVLGNSESFMGTRQIMDASCLVNAFGEENMIIASATSLSGINNSIWENVVSLAGYYSFISFLILIGVCVYTDDISKEIDDDDEEENEEENVPLTKFNIGEIQNQLLLKGLKGLTISVIVFLAMDMFFSDKSIVSILWSGRWEKGFNILAFSNVLLTVTVVMLILRLILKSLKYVAKGMSARTATICQLICSVLKVITVIWLIIFSLTQFGIDATKIVAGIGISGLALGMGANDIIKDLLAGIFIIFDGHIKVGDMIQVGDFRGKVTHIGIRTTKILWYNSEKSINNSSMVNVINLDNTTSSSIITFVVPFNTDIEKIKEAVNGLDERIKKEYNVDYIKFGRFGGVTEYTSYGMRCVYYVGIPEEKRTSTIKKAYVVLKKVLDENNIELAVAPFVETNVSKGR